jgi:hypothetical protein
MLVRRMSQHPHYDSVSLLDSTRKIIPNTFKSGKFDENKGSLRLLLPSSVIKRLIQKLTKNYNVQINFSPKGYFYPNSKEDICLIIGSVKDVLRASQSVLQHIQEALNSRGETKHMNCVRFLIPNIMAESFIEQIKSHNVSSVSVSAEQLDLVSRIVTIESGDETKCNEALYFLVRETSQDERHCAVNFNLLLPSSAVATLIERFSVEMRQLSQNENVQILTSKANDIHSNDQICLTLVGSVKVVLNVSSVILDFTDINYFLSRLQIN